MQETDSMRKKYYFISFCHFFTAIVWQSTTNTQWMTTQREREKSEERKKNMKKRTTPTNKHINCSFVPIHIVSRRSLIYNSCTMRLKQWTSKQHSSWIKPCALMFFFSATYTKCSYYINNVNCVKCDYFFPDFEFLLLLRFFFLFSKWMKNGSASMRIDSNLSAGCIARIHTHTHIDSHSPPKS